MAEEHVADVVDGLGDMAAAELAALGATVVEERPAEVRFRGAVGAVLARSRLVSAVYLSVAFDVPRPRALLGDAALRRLVAAVASVAERRGMRTFRLAAAGVESEAFTRLAAALAAGTGLVCDQEDGALLARFRRRGAGWEALLRLTPLPLSARAWRVCDLPGGANATVAAAMAQLSGEGGGFLNLMCGSGTLIVERALAGYGGPYVGVDVDRAAIACAERNLDAAGVRDRRLLVDDVTRQEFAVTDELGGTVPCRVVAADPPWGDAVGDHAHNEALHAALLTAAARHLDPGGRFVLLTHEVRVFRRLVTAAGGWRVSAERRVEHGGHRPLLAVLERVS